MSWRTIVITGHVKLDLKMGYMVVRGEETKRIFMDEISVIIIENPSVSVTGCLLTECMEKKIKVIFCDNKRNPNFELIPYYGCHDTSLKFRYQLEWNDNIKESVSTEIIAEKIRCQQRNLELWEKPNEAKMLKEYARDIQPGDETNREGHAAKVYFNALFGMGFTRSEDNAINAALNYGYSLILSLINREITANGYMTQLGIYHDNMFNFFNLSCDLMEPFRTIVDGMVKELMPGVFETDEKHYMLGIFQKQLIIDGRTEYLPRAVSVYCKSVFEALNNKDISLLKFYTNE